MHPDSFSDGGQFQTTDAIKRQCDYFIEHDTDIIDVGGESTRPGSEPVTLEDEWHRVKNALAIASRYPAVLVSIDTQKAEIARRALAEGADIVNDVSGLRDPQMPTVVAEAQCPTIVMHMRGSPKNNATRRDNLRRRLYGHRGEPKQSMERAQRAGLAADKLIVDPGIGFGKTLEHNLVLTRQLHRFHALARRCSTARRKRFLGELTGKEAHERDVATAAVIALGIEFGADIVRISRPSDLWDAVKVARALAALGVPFRRKACYFRPTASACSSTG